MSSIGHRGQDPPRHQMAKARLIPKIPILPIELQHLIIQFADRQTLFVLLLLDKLYHLYICSILYRNLQYPNSNSYLDLGNILPDSSKTKRTQLEKVRFLALGCQADLYRMEPVNYRRYSELQPVRPDGHRAVCGHSRCDGADPGGSPARIRRTYANGTLRSDPEGEYEAFLQASHLYSHGICHDCYLYSDPSIPVLPNLQALRFPNRYDIAFCQATRPCPYCDFFKRLTPKVWVIEDNGVGAIESLSYVPPSLEIVVINARSHMIRIDDEELWRVVDIYSFVTSLAHPLHIILINAFQSLSGSNHIPPSPIDESILAALINSVAGSQHRSTVVTPFVSYEEPVGITSFDYKPTLMPSQFDPKVLEKAIRAVMLIDGYTEAEIENRLKCVEFAGLEQLEKEGWAPVMGSRKSKEWLSWPTIASADHVV